MEPGESCTRRVNRGRLRCAPMQARPTVTVNMAVTADGKIDTVERRGARLRHG